MPERTMMFGNALFDLYLEMPSLFKRNGRVYRKALKRLNERLAIVPNSATGFSPQIPHILEWIIVKFAEVRGIFFPESQVQSEGSYPNHAELLRQNVEYQVIVEATIKDPECLDPSIFNTNGILQLLNDHLNRRADHFTLLSLILTFGRWQKKFGALNSPRNKKINKLQ